MKRAFVAAVLLGAAALSADEPALRLDYGPILRAVDARSAHLLFHARDASGREREWTAGLELSPVPDLDPAARLPVPELRVGPETDYVAHLSLAGLAPQTRYYYRVLVDGRPEAEIASFRTAPELGGKNADFSVAFFADQHTEDRPETTPLPAYGAAAEAQPLFWAQLGDVVPGGLDRRSEENRRSAPQLQALFERNYAPGSPQARFARAFPLNLATINDHEIANNYSLNWHVEKFGRRATREANTLHDRVNHYNLSLARWWNYLGWGPGFADRLGQRAVSDHGASTMAEAPAELLRDSEGPRACVKEESAGGFAAGAFVHLYEAGREAFHTNVAKLGAPGACGPGAAAILLADTPKAPYTVARGARLAVGGRYDLHGHYHGLQPFPFVEFFVLDTTSYRGDPYEYKNLFAKDDHRDGDHSRHPWNAQSGARFIYGDVAHGANRTTDGVRSWLGPAQKQAFLDALRGSHADVLVIAAGYPLVSGKFKNSSKYYQGRESGFDYASEYQELVTVLDATGKLVLWVHGDGHSPQLVRLEKNLYQMQVGASYLNESTPSRSPISAGARGYGDLFGGGLLISGLQPDLTPDDDDEDGFGGWLDQFHGYLRLYFHPGSEVLRSSEAGQVSRGADDRTLEIVPGREPGKDPAEGVSGREVVGRVARLRAGGETLYSVVTGYRYEPGKAILTLADPVARAKPDELRILVDGRPWVEVRWFDERGIEWRELSFVLKKDL